MTEEDHMSDEKPLQPWAEEAFELFRTLFPMVELDTSYLDDDLWETAYVICFGVNELCEWFDCRVRIAFHCNETDFQPRIYCPDEDLSRAILKMVQTFVDDPYEIGSQILAGQWQLDKDFEEPDHIARLEALDLIMSGGADGVFEGTRGSPAMLDRLITLMRAGAITPEEWAEFDPELLAAIPARLKEQVKEVEAQLKQLTAEPVCKSPADRSRWEAYWKHPAPGTGYLN
jgi:hypothetical protein